MNEQKEYWWNKYRILIIVIVCLLMWIGFFAFYYLKADEITKDPCSICSKRMGENVICTIGGIIPVTRTYYPNGSIVTNKPEVIIDYTNKKYGINFTGLID